MNRCLLLVYGFIFIAVPLSFRFFRDLLVNAANEDRDLIIVGWLYCICCLFFNRGRKLFVCGGMEKSTAGRSLQSITVISTSLRATCNLRSPDAF
ncbi:hypothetical protein HD806DRAFT_486568 [Xylariaceae sp. AK1471]|nr:hypothetical protein HD806DRAFT_486568 [Xylariaceae sp. AK1471]